MSAIALLAIFQRLVWVVCVGVTTVRGARPGTSRSGVPTEGAPRVA